METAQRHAEVDKISTTANLQSSPAEEFKAIDTMVRTYEKQWVTVAQQCIRVQAAELWRHGGFHSYEHWLHDAAPKSARTIFYHVGVVKELSPDFTDAEMSELRPEAAKTLCRVSKGVRHDPAVRNAAKAGKKHLVAVLSETHPEEHIEHTEKMELHFEKSFMGIFRTFIEGIRIIEADPEMSYEKALELAVIAWFNEPFEDSGHSNLQRVKHIQGWK